MNNPTATESETVRRIVADLQGRAAVALVAEGLNLSRAEVHGVVTFYHYFRHTAPGKHSVSLCRAEACHSPGAEALVEHAKRRLGVPERFDGLIAERGRRTAEQRSLPRPARKARKSPATA